jgi:ZIP family zinc transporter
LVPIAALLFGALALISTFAGGYFALKRQNELLLFLAFAGGALIGIPFFDLIPSALTLNIDNVDLVLAAVVIGFMYYHITQRTIAVHSHNRAQHMEVAASEPFLGKIGAGGLVVHSFFDGFGIGVGFQVSSVVGVLIALAVVFHDFSDGLNTVTLMFRHGNDRGAALRFLASDAMAPLVGVMASLVITASPVTLSYILAFFSGEFLAIGSGDLLPEAHAKEPSWRLVAMTVLGVGVIFVVTRFI